MSKTEIKLRGAAIKFMRDVTKMNPTSTPRSCLELLEAVRASQAAEEKQMKRKAKL